MRKHFHDVSTLWIIFVSLLLYLLFISPAIAGSPIRTAHGVVLQVSDGDTITVETRDRTKLKIRLYGIDAPEIDQVKRKPLRIIKSGQPFGIEAKAYLSSMIFGQTVRLDIMNVSRYRRLVSIVWMGEKNVNLEMIKAGMAETYIEYLKDQSYRDQFLRAEMEAQLNNLGIWSQGSMYERPNDFRKRQKIGED